MEAITAHAPAKINLALHVTGRRPDGYHEIETLAVFTRFGDRVTVEHSEETRFSITGAFANGLPANETNLVLRALDALRRAFPKQTRQHVSITLEKNLPVASGIGGGSSDAAATLRALAFLWALDLEDDEFIRIASPLGADLPMCLTAQPLMAGGIGDALSRVTAFPALGLVLVNPGLPVSTADVFRQLARRDSESLPPLPPDVEFHSLRAWLGRTRNDLQGPACQIQPAIGQALSALDKSGAGFARMSGSGATCFGLFETGNVAKRAAAAIRTRHPGWFVAATRSMPSGNA